jgi:hypothetical protein
VTLDELAEVATRELATATGRGLSPDAMLARLHRARHRRTAVVSVVAAAAIAVAVAGVGAAVGRDGAPPSPRPPAAGLRTPTDQTGDNPCDQPLITCPHGGGRWIRVALIDPVELSSAATNFEAFPRIFSVDLLDAYRTGVRHNTGFTVVERAVPVRNSSQWSRDPAAGSTARSIATWLAHRPFLQPTTAVPVSVGGWPAWRVRVVRRDGARMTASRNDEPVAPLFRNPSGARVGVAPNLPGEITLLRSPAGHGVIAIWSWTTSPQTSVLAGSRLMIDSLHFT